MPRSPSSRALSNRVTLYHAVRTQDEDGSDIVTYPTATGSDVPCSVQPAAPERFLDSVSERLIQKTMYDVYFPTDYGLKADDRIVWVDTAGVSHSLFVMGSADQAGKGGCFVASCEERL